VLSDSGDSLSGFMIRRTPLPPEVGVPHHIALGGDVLAAGAGEVLWLMTSPKTSHPQPLTFPWVIAEIAISASGRFIAAAPSAPRSEIVVYDRLQAEKMTISKSSDRWLAGFGFVADSASDLLVVSRNQFTCTTVDLRGGLREIGLLHGRGFEFDRFTALWDDLFVSIGHFSGETRDSLVLVRAGPDGCRGEEVDFAYRLVAGPADHRAFVVFRDPEDAEEADPDDDDGDDGRTDIHNFHGIYVRDVANGELRERIAWDDPGVRRGDRCFATGQWVAITGSDGVSLIPRGDPPREVTKLTTPSVGLDALSRRIALVAEGSIDVIQL
jgi:hypothetical protein